MNDIALREREVFVCSIGGTKELLFLQCGDNSDRQARKHSVEAAKKQGGRAKLYCGGTKHTTMGQAEKRQEEGSYFHYLDSTLKFTKEL